MPSMFYLQMHVTISDFPMKAGRMQNDYLNSWMHCSKTSPKSNPRVKMTRKQKWKKSNL